MIPSGSKVFYQHILFITDFSAFLVYSKVTGIESVNLYNSSDRNDPIPPIKNETTIRNVIGLTFDFDNGLIFYSDIVRGDLQAYNKRTQKSWVVVDGKFVVVACLVTFFLIVNL